MRATSASHAHADSVCLPQPSHVDVMNRRYRMTLSASLAPLSDSEGEEQLVKRMVKQMNLISSRRYKSSIRSHLSESESIADDSVVKNGHSLYSRRSRRWTFLPDEGDDIVVKHASSTRRSRTTRQRYLSSDSDGDDSMTKHGNDHRYLMASPSPPFSDISEGNDVFKHTADAASTRRSKTLARRAMSFDSDGDEPVFKRNLATCSSAHQPCAGSHHQTPATVE
jgi:hypothetical protein